MSAAVLAAAGDAMQDIIVGVLAIAIGALFCFRGWIAMRIVIPIWGAFAGFLWIPYYPVWGITFVVISVIVIWALTAHGRDIVEYDRY